MNDDQQKEYRKLMASFKKTSTIKECFYHNVDECKGDIKQSHSVQRNGRLSIIEGDVNGNQAIYTFTSNVPSIDDLIADLKPVGEKKLLLFLAFVTIMIQHDLT